MGVYELAHVCVKAKFNIHNRCHGIKKKKKIPITEAIDEKVDYTKEKHLLYSQKRVTLVLINSRSRTSLTISK